VPKACRPYRAKTKGKVERPFRYVREDFFLARSFRNLDDLNAQFTQWLDQVANRRLHGTTGASSSSTSPRSGPASRACRPGRSTPSSASSGASRTRAWSRSAAISTPSPTAPRRRPVEVQVTASEVHILEDGRLVAAHPVLEGRGRRRIAEGHRRLPPSHNSTTPARAPRHRHQHLPAAGVAPRSLAIYEAIGRRLAAGEPAR
jgi:hypothetical protein